MDNAPLFKALTAFQRSMHNVHKGERAQVQSSRGSFSYTYADIAAVIEAVKEPLAKNGLCYLQIVTNIDGEPALKTVLAHESGASIEGTVPLRFDSISDPQKFGGALTYVRRYQLLGILGLATDDDDAQSASLSHQNRQPATQPVPPRQSPSPVPPNAPGPSQGADDEMDWTEMWKLIRPFGPQNKQQLEAYLLGPIDGMTPNQVYDVFRVRSANPLQTPPDPQRRQVQYPLTEKQLKTIRDTLPKKGMDEKAWPAWQMYTLSTDEQIAPEDLSKQEASTVIDALFAMPDNKEMQAMIEASGR